MIKRSFGLVQMIFLCCLVSGCASKYVRENFVEQLDDESVPYVIDVRTKGEFEKGYIPGAININVFSLPFRMDEIKADKDDPVIVYCAHGPRAGMAGFFLRLAGFKKVYHLEGDWVQWKKDGLPVDMPAHELQLSVDQNLEDVSGEGEATTNVSDPVD